MSRVRGAARWLPVLVAMLLCMPRPGAAVQRIVSLAPSVTEILFAIGADEQLVGVSQHCDYPLAAKLKPRAGQFNHADPVRLRELQPDIVLFSEYPKAEGAAALEAAGFSSLVLPAHSIAEISAAVRRLGVLSGREQSAASVAQEIEAAVLSVRRRIEGIPEERRPTVYVEVDGPRRLYSLGAGSFMHDVLRTAGGRNALTGNAGAYYEVSLQEVVRADPEVMLIDHPFQYKVGVANRDGWSNIRAVREQRIYDSTEFDMILFNRPGPRVVDALRQVSQLLHPEVWNAP